MISTLLDRLFQRHNVTSGTQVKQRLKFILAHDRAAIEPQVFDNMRHEIMRVVSKYVELDEGALDIRLESDKRMTALIANLPIRMVREELPDLVALFDETSEGIDSNSEQVDPLALEMDQFADEALDAIAAKEIPKSAPDNLNTENVVELAERTTEVTNKLRNVTNKSQETDKPIEVNIANNIANNPNDSVPIAVNNLVETQASDQTDQLELSLNLPESSISQDSSNEQSSEISN